MWQRLEKWYNNLEAKVTTADQYFAICEQMGVEPNPDKIPPELTDFPVEVQEALEIFNNLNDRIVADIGYLGKDYTILPLYMENIEDRRLFLDVLSWMDNKIIKKSAEEMKRARERAKAH